MDCQNGDFEPIVNALRALSAVVELVRMIASKPKAANPLGDVEQESQGKTVMPPTARP
jgi:hypothetical protein